jgi:hypothetical protein
LFYLLNKQQSNYDTIYLNKQHFNYDKKTAAQKKLLNWKNINLQHVHFGKKEQKQTAHRWRQKHIKILYDLIDGDDMIDDPDKIATHIKKNFKIFFLLTLFFK